MNPCPTPRFGNRNLPALSCCVVLLLAVGLAGSQGNPTAEKPAIEKPEHDRAETFEELVEIPEYKDARLFVPAEAPLPRLHRWEEHKRAMHLKALKRSGQDHPDLRRIVEALARTALTGKDASAGNTASDGATDATRREAKDKESSFQKLDDNLTIFRFTNFNSYIKPGAEKKAVALGKAFFWDPRFSSDHKVACATCHYAAGADHRTRATVSLPVNFGIHIPWPNPILPPELDSLRPYNLSSLDLAAGSAELARGNSLGVFDPASLGGFKTREAIGSIGVPHRRLLAIDKDDEAHEPFSLDDAKGKMVDPIQRLIERVEAIEATYRQVTQRNAASVINAVFNSRNFSR